MKNIKNEKGLIIIAVLPLMTLFMLLGGIYSYNENNSESDETIKDNAYIDIWKDISSQSDIDLYSIGTDENEKLYTGAKPTHYLVNKDGTVYTYTASSYKNATTGESDPATVDYVKTLSQSELKNLEDDLKSIIESNPVDSSNSSYSHPAYWYIEIDGNLTKVDVNVQTAILDNYL